MCLNICLADVSSLSHLVDLGRANGCGCIGVRGLNGGNRALRFEALPVWGDCMSACVLDFVGSVTGFVGSQYRLNGMQQLRQQLTPRPLQAASRGAAHRHRVSLFSAIDLIMMG